MVHYMKVKEQKSQNNSWALKHQKLVTAISLIVVTLVLISIAHIIFRNSLASRVDNIKNSKKELLNIMIERENSIKNFNIEIQSFDANFSNKNLIKWYKETDYIINQKILSEKEDNLSQEYIDKVALLLKSEDKVKKSFSKYKKSIETYNIVIKKFPLNIYAKNRDLKPIEIGDLNKAFSTKF